MYSVVLVHIETIAHMSLFLLLRHLHVVQVARVSITDNPEKETVQKFWSHVCKLSQCQIPKNPAQVF